MKMNDKVYDVLKWIATIALPAIGTLYFALASIWGLPMGEQVVGTITAVDTFLGVLLGLSNRTYEGAGYLKIDTSDETKDIYRLDLNVPPEELDEKKTITLRVAKDVDLSQK